MSKIQNQPHKEGKKLSAKTESSLNFKVSPEEKREFKLFAVEQGMTMLALLKEGFELSKEKRKK
ncbi:hypothetical protein N5E66_07370 [Acinetobacter johnsonii]|uniref:Uncharacterized protein n=1 Tax=Acinetobacter colistiniresistens TaxID=280145 RepID=S3U3Z0_9GAMM|nr:MULTISPECIES: hypothetical protein [Acinetobacter]EPG42625.1 hypothetical protein F907_00249 [Acinetobacter colistiniresistens]MCH7339123.1 hypothetical protein [Acinetobacter higginsii]MCJ0829321.1 hypothetical protein [Acinetobacter sp. NIPH1876]MDH1488022.1 hypothetical protein [Acinetobacter johnsonii]MDH1613954.1 hypothetical protein [Acinetobacter johnsonii]